MLYFCIFNTALIKLLIFILLNIAYELCSKLELKDSYSAWLVFSHTPKIACATDYGSSFYFTFFLLFC